MHVMRMACPFIQHGVYQYWSVASGRPTGVVSYVGWEQDAPYLTLLRNRLKSDVVKGRSCCLLSLAVASNTTTPRARLSSPYNALRGSRQKRLQ